MYIYQRQLSGPRSRPREQPITLRPSEHYCHPALTQARSRTPATVQRTTGEFEPLQEAATASRVTNGEFGRTLSRIGIPANVVDLLKSSKTFMMMAGKLDNRYVSIWHPTQNRHRRLDTSAGGVVTSGTFTGRRVLDVQESSTGSMFESYGSPDNAGYYDAIRIKKPARAETLRWIEVIAHETGHAFNLVTRTSPPAAKMADRIRDAIADEIVTRKIEAAVVSEIMQTTQGSQQLKGQTPNTGATDPATVERDFFPTPLRRTYLEQFVLGELMREAINREGLTDSQVKAKNREVESIPLKGWRSRAFSSDYSKFRFWLRVIDFRWRRLMELRRPGTPEFERLKETILQENANAFFGGLVGYTPRPVQQRRGVQPMRQAPAHLGQPANAANRFNKCWDPQKRAIQAAFVDALRAVNNAAAVLGTAYGRPDRMTQRTRDLLNRHFHTTDRGNILEIFRKLFRISQALKEGLSFECEINCGSKVRCGYAWATQRFGGRGDIHICFDNRPGFCSFVNLTAQQQAALIIHEAAHRHVGIGDRAYVWERTPPRPRDYTKLTPKQAMDNADSYAWFCVEL